MNKKPKKTLPKELWTESSRIKFRKISKKDLQLLRDWRNSKEIFPYNSQFFLLNMTHQYKWYEQINKKNSDRIMFIITYEQKPIGVWD